MNIDAATIHALLEKRGTYPSWATEYGEPNDPKKILADAKARFPNHEFIFTHDEQSQFYLTFSLWKRPLETE